MLLVSKNDYTYKEENHEKALHKVQEREVLAQERGKGQPQDDETMGGPWVKALSLSLYIYI
jgi:hypothetical protein